MSTGETWTLDHVAVAGRDLGELALRFERGSGGAVTPARTAV